MIIAGLYMGLIASPPDYYQGEVVRIMYVHVPLAHTSLFAYIVLSVGSIWYLWKRDPIVDNMCHAVATLGAIFTTLALVTGMIWGKPTWNTWWTWEPRLTTTMILWLIYVAYLMVRSYAPTQSKGAIYAAAVGIIGFIDVPIVYYSVVWWRSIHPSPVVGPFAQADALEGTMAWILLFSLITFLFFFAYMVAERIGLRNTEEALGQIRFALRRRGR